VGWCLSGSLTGGDGQRVYISAGRAKIAHEARYERNRAAIARYFGQGDLLADIARSVQDLRFALTLPAVEGIQPGCPPVVITVRGGSRSDKSLSVRAPVVFVNEQVRR